MKIHYLFRQFHAHQISIEKVFDTISQQMKTEGIEVKKITNPYPFTIFGLMSALLFFRKNQADINHITGDIHWSVLGLDAKKTVLTIHDLVGLRDLTGIRRKIYYFLWLYFPVKKARYITVVSEKTKNEIIGLLPGAAKKITVIPNPLTTEVTPLIIDKKNLKPHVLVVGTRANKNVDRIIEAIANLDILLTIVGELSEIQKKELERRNIRYTNRFQISDQELDECYDQADILCFPSLYEGFGLPILEAQARNCAVITSNISPMKEIASDSALLVNPESSVQIKEAVEKIVKNPELKKKLILQGRENVKKYSLENITKQYVHLYHKIVKENDIN